ncbi:MAG: hypothetical protein ACI4S2_13880 [Lachnospiraceae bacterium]
MEPIGLHNEIICEKQNVGIGYAFQNVNNVPGEELFVMGNQRMPYL